MNNDYDENENNNADKHSELMQDQIKKDNDKNKESKNGME